MLGADRSPALTVTTHATLPSPRSIWSRARSEVTPDRLAWLTPVAVFVAMRYAPVGLDKLVVAAVALAVIVLVSRWPAVVLTVLMAVIPFNFLLLSTLYRLGVPAGVLRPVGSWKEGMIAAVAVAALRKAYVERHRPDTLDKLVLALVGLGAVYLAVPALLLGRSVGASIGFNGRLLGFRTDVLYLVLFLACRHLRLDAGVARRLVRTVLVVATAAALVGIYEWSFSSQWNHFVVTTVRVPQYQLDVLGSNPVDLGKRLYDVRFYGSLGGREFVRVGGPMLDYLSFGFYLAVALALSIELQVRGRGRPWMVAAMPILGAALLFTQTRAALIAAAVGLFMVIRPQRGRSTVHRLRFVFVTAGLLVFAVPAVLGAGLSERFSGDQSSDSLHRSALSNGISTMIRHPIGLGLTTAAGAAQRLGNKELIIAENQYLQVGLQLGIAALGLYVAATVLLARMLRRGVAGAVDERAPPDAQSSRDVSGHVTTAAAARTMLVGLMLGGMFLQPFIEFSVSWTAWALLGVGLGGLDSLRDTERPSVALEEHR